MDFCLGFRETVTKNLSYYSVSKLPSFLPYLSTWITFERSVQNGRQDLLLAQSNFIISLQVAVGVTQTMFWDYAVRRFGYILLWYWPDFCKQENFFVQMVPGSILLCRLQFPYAFILPVLIGG